MNSISYPHFSAFNLHKQLITGSPGLPSAIMLNFSYPEMLTWPGSPYQVRLWYKYLEIFFCFAPLNMKILVRKLSSHAF